MKNYDFGGWATKYDMKCSDGRTIKHGAFEHLNGSTVPLVWNHNHMGPENIIGKAVLEHRENGVYAHATFNDTDSAKTARDLVKHGDITNLSIYANKLKQDGPFVNHGEIREVSLVLAGANPGAFIDCVMVHSDGDEDPTQGIVYNDDVDSLVLEHSVKDDEDEDKEDKTKDKTKDKTEEDETKEDKKKKKEDEGKLEHSEMSVADVYAGMTEDQKKVVALVADQLLKESQNEEEQDMKHNVFENNNKGVEDTLQHGEILSAALADAKKGGSLKEAVLAHAADYGITNIETLFPEAHKLTNEPGFIDRDQTWVGKFFNKTKKLPFSRLKSVYADITGDDARALGYVKGKLKKEEVFGLLKRTTSPTTVYKKQKLDRDDIIDITDFNVVTWLKGEMRGKLQEEIARAMLIGDGRSSLSDDKINEANIRPIYNDSDLYAIKADLVANADRGQAIIETLIRAKKDYEGTGIPMMFTTSEVIADLQLIKDQNGRFIYPNLAAIATQVGVSEIVPVPVMKDLQRKVSEGVMNDVLAIVVNPNDYHVGADKGGAVSLFDDFDIDYNQYKYLIETRCSGSLMQPKTAIIIETKHAEA